MSNHTAAAATPGIQAQAGTAIPAQISADKSLAGVRGGALTLGIAPGFMKLAGALSGSSLKPGPRETLMAFRRCLWEGIDHPGYDQLTRRVACLCKRSVETHVKILIGVGILREVERGGGRGTRWDPNKGEYVRYGRAKKLEATPMGRVMMGIDESAVISGAYVNMPLSYHEETASQRAETLILSQKLKPNPPGEPKKVRPSALAISAAKTAAAAETPEDRSSLTATPSSQQRLGKSRAELSPSVVAVCKCACRACRLGFVEHCNRQQPRQRKPTTPPRWTMAELAAAVGTKKAAGGEGTHQPDAVAYALRSLETRPDITLRSWGRVLGWAHGCAVRWETEAALRAAEAAKEKAIRTGRKANPASESEQLRQRQQQVDEELAHPDAWQHVERVGKQLAARDPATLDVIERIQLDQYLKLKVRQ